MCNSTCQILRVATGTPNENSLFGVNKNEPTLENATFGYLTSEA